MGKINREKDYSEPKLTTIFKLIWEHFNRKVWRNNFFRSEATEDNSDYYSCSVISGTFFYLKKLLVVARFPLTFRWIEASHRTQHVWNETVRQSIDESSQGSTYTISNPGYEIHSETLFIFDTLLWRDERLPIMKYIFMCSTDFNIDLQKTGLHSFRFLE